MFSAFPNAEVHIAVLHEKGSSSCAQVLRVHLLFELGGLDCDYDSLFHSASSSILCMHPCTLPIFLLPPLPFSMLGYFPQLVSEEY